MLAISISPRRSAIYFKSEKPLFRNNNHIGRLEMPKDNRPKITMSQKAQNRIRNAINWLCYLSPTRTVSHGKNKKIKNFSISFITLTLPAKQRHSHQDIRTKCLNHFLTILRQRFKVHNYVWKAELQQNGNIHFHLTIDKYIHYMIIRKYWNRTLSKLGYISDYAKKFRNMTFQEYADYRKKRGEKNLKKIKTAYTYGVNTFWRNPNTTDVKKVNQIRNLASYLSKYLSKKITDKNNTPEQVKSAKSYTGRIWFLSQSLSKMKNVSIPYEGDNRRALQFMEKLKSVQSKVFDWVTLFWYDMATFPPNLREFFRQILVSHAINNGYQFPAGFPP